MYQMPIICYHHGMSLGYLLTIYNENIVLSTTIFYKILGT